MATAEVGTETPYVDVLLAIIHQHVEQHESAFAPRPDWAHQSSAHLLLALGRRFTPAPRPCGLVGMPERLCSGNAARYATDHSDTGMVYAEGLALINVGRANLPLPHAWVVSPDGEVLDPTWDDDLPARAYIGVPIADQALWPLDGGGLLADFEKTLPLLRHGLATTAIADVGWPLI